MTSVLVMAVSVNKVWFVRHRVWNLSVTAETKAAHSPAVLIVCLRKVCETWHNAFHMMYGTVGASHTMGRLSHIFMRWFTSIECTADVPYFEIQCSSLLSMSTLNP